MHQAYSPLQKDIVLRDAFSQLKARGIESAWSTSQQPFTDLNAECFRLMADASFRRSLSIYLRAHTTLPRAVEMFFTSIAMAARARWDDAPEEVRAVVARGWFLGRWIPTFLIVDGPIGRFMTGEDSPLSACYGSEYPILTAARDFLGDRNFKLVRNGFAHWAFDWEIVGRESFVVAYDPERDLPIMKLHQAEADAYHIAAFSLVETLHDAVLSKA